MRSAWHGRDMVKLCSQLTSLNPNKKFEILGQKLSKITEVLTNLEMQTTSLYRGISKKSQRFQNAESLSLFLGLDQYSSFRLLKATTLEIKYCFWLQHRSHVGIRRRCDNDTSVGDNFSNDGDRQHSRFGCNVGSNGAYSDVKHRR